MESLTGNKIAIIIPYFGKKQPVWIDYYFLTCRLNPKIDWIIFSDCITAKDQFKNVHSIKFSLEDFNKLSSNRLGFTIKVKHPYKLCDFKPAFGHIFSDYIQSYEYWGYGDLDVIYGDIYKFINQSTIKGYDVISSHTDFVPGHLCFLKNQERIKRLYTQVPRYKEIFQSPTYFGFDEQIITVKISTRPLVYKISKSFRIIYIQFLKRLILYFRNNILIKVYKKIYKSGNVDIRDFSSLINRLYLDKTLAVKYHRVYYCDFTFKLENIKDWQIRWENGKLFNFLNKEEIMYFHFQLAKSKKTFTVVNHNINDLKSFTITKKGILTS